MGIAARAISGTVSSENSCLDGNVIASLVGNVNGDGINTAPLHVNVCEGYLDERISPSFMQVRLFHCCA